MSYPCYTVKCNYIDNNNFSGDGTLEYSVHLQQLSVFELVGVEINNKIIVCSQE